MEAKDIKKKGMNGVKMVIFGRTLIVLGAFLIQFLFVYLLYRTLEEHSLEVYGLFRILMVVVLLHLLSSSGNPEFRLVWMLPMVIFPVFGAVFYLYITINPGAGKIYERLQKLSVFTRKYLEEDETAKETLEREDVQVGRLAEYMRKNANCAVYHKTHADYYPLGEDQFEALMEDLRSAQKFIFMEYFIIKEGYLWHEVLEVLKEKVQQGVEVRVMYDGMCALSLLPEFYPKVLEKYGIRCKMYAPIHPVFSSHYNNRDHRKILVVDGRVAHTGVLCLREECCGMDIMAKVSEITEERVKVGPGTLYHLLEQFSDAGMIQETKVDGRKRSYLLTESGKELLQAEYERICRQAADYRRYMEVKETYEERKA